MEGGQRKVGAVCRSCLVRDCPTRLQLQKDRCGSRGFGRSLSDPERRERSLEGGGVKLRCCVGANPLGPIPDPLVPSLRVCAWNEQFGQRCAASCGMPGGKDHRVRYDGLQSFPSLPNRKRYENATNNVKERYQQAAASESGGDIRRMPLG